MVADIFAQPYFLLENLELKEKFQIWGFEPFIFLYKFRFWGPF